MVKFSSKKNKEFWDEFALKSKDNPFGASGGRHLVEIENDFIFTHLKSIKPKSILDIGCGNGKRTMLFSKYTSQRILGVDYSGQMIFEAKKSLSKQSPKIQKKIKFEHVDINQFSPDETYDVVISCRCIINQTSSSNQIKLLKKLHDMLNHNGSLILAEISQQGMQEINFIRKKFGLSPMNKRWHNLQINEEKVLPELKKSFKIKEIKRAGAFYFLSRVFYPALIFPKNPKSESDFNELSLKSEFLLNHLNTYKFFENFGGHLLMHLTKNEKNKK